MPLPKDELIVNQAIWDAYETTRKMNGLSIRLVETYRQDYKTLMIAKMEGLEAQGRKQELLYGQYGFMAQMVDNGWTVADMEFMAELYEMAQKNTKYEKQGQDLLTLLRDTDFSTLDVRVRLLNRIKEYVDQCGAEYPRRDNVQKLLEKVGNAEFNYGEYPKDRGVELNAEAAGAFNTKVMVEKGKELPIREALLINTRAYNALSEKEKQEIRSRGKYVMSDLDEEKILDVPKNLGQNARGIEVTNRQAIQTVYGYEVYDSIDEKHRGTLEDRTVKIHNAVGNRLIREGTTVLEFDLAGSGYNTVRREYAGQHGKLNTKTEVGISQIRQHDKEYGVPLRDSSGKVYNGIRKMSKKVTLKDDTVVNKIRYTISGPGLFNVGDHSIENNRVYVKNLAKNELVKYFEEWVKDPSKAHEINIRLTGHSRGAVAAEEGAQYINDFLKEYAKKHKEAEPFLKYISFDLTQRDAVPGFGTFWRLGKKDIRNIPNMKATIFCSMAQDHGDMIFPLQNVRGAGRIIIGTTEHGMDLGSIDQSQSRYKEDGKAHRAGFYDADTGEYYRGSGLSELPDGVYIADERYNIVRLTSYSQIGKLIDEVYASAPKQKGRVASIHDMVRNWFVDNELSVSFKTETERENAQDRAFDAMGSLMRSGVSRVKGVQREIQKLDKIRMSALNPAEIIQQNEALIKACKKYMKKTAIPAEGDSAYRMNLVSDIMSFAQRENNYLKRGLDKNNQVQHEGYVERQLDRERKRLEQEQRLRETFAAVAEHCKEVTVRLDATRQGKLNSEEYNRFYAALKRGSMLNTDSSVNDFNRVTKEIMYAAVTYHVKHMEATSKDGIIRDTESQNIVSYMSGIRKVTGELGRGIERKDNSLDDVIRNRQMRIGHLKKQREANEGKITPQLEAEKRLDEAIRIESARYNRLKKTPAGKKQLGVNNRELSAARLVYLQTVKKSCEANGYQNPQNVIKSISDQIKINQVAETIRQQNGFSALVRGTRPEKLLEEYNKLAMAPKVRTPAKGPTL